MIVEERRIAVDELRTGMFVCRLDREWLGTPFPIQGFEVASQEDLDQLARYCRHVYVDVRYVRPTPVRRLMTLEGNRIGGVPYRATLPYTVRTTVRDELPKASAAQAAVLQMAQDIELDLRAGRPLSAERVQASVEPLVASVLRNPDAVFWLLGAIRRDRYSHAHALHCSALCAAFGRHLALPRDLVLDLATGGFLQDIGMASLPQALLDLPRALTPEETAQVRGHVEAGLRMLDEAGLASLTVREMVGGHHERHDGSGYVAGLAGEAIPLAARIGGLVDSYDALCSHRPFRIAQAPHQVLQVLYRERGKLFQEEVIEHFMQCLGVYPTGSLVELSNGEVAVVMAQNQARRLRPRVMVVLDDEKRPLRRFRDIDLMAVDEGAGGRPSLMISAALPPGAYGVDAVELFLD